MATLTGSVISASYDQLLTLPSGGGNTTNLVALTDGNAGTTFGLKIATTSISIDATNKLYLDGGGTTYITESADGEVDFICDGSYMLSLNQGSPGECVFNEASSANIDFRIESDGEAKAFFIDASANHLTINDNESAFTTTIHNDVGEAVTVTASTVVINDDGHASIDFRVESDTEDEAIFLDSDINTLYINKGETDFTTLIKNINDKCLDITSAGAIFNEDGHATNDFRVESSGSTHMLFVDSGTNEIGIGDSSPDAVVTINEGALDGNILTFKGGGVSHGMTDLEETDTYASFGEVVEDGGGLNMIGLTDTTGNANRAVWIAGYLGEACSTTKSTSGKGVIDFTASIKNSGTIASCGTDGNLLTINDNQTVRFIFDAEGTMHGDEAAATFSDNRLKSEQKVVPYGLDEVLKLQPKWYKKDSGYIDEIGGVVLEGRLRERIGFIAQEVKAVIPEIVKDVDEATSFYSLNDGDIMAVAIKAIQELSAKVTTLESKVAALESA